MEGVLGCTPLPDLSTGEVVIREDDRDRSVCQGVSIFSGVIKNDVFPKVALVVLYEGWRIQDDESLFVFEQGCVSVGGVGSYDAIVASCVDSREGVAFI